MKHFSKVTPQAALTSRAACAGSPEQFAAKVKELMAQARALTPETRKAMVELLQDARTRIMGQVSLLNPATFQAAQLNAIKNSIDQALEQFRIQAATAVNALQGISATIGAAQVELPLQAAGISAVPLGAIATDKVAVAQAYTADLVKGLTQKAAADLNGVIQRAFLGGQQMTDILKAVADALGENSPLADRVERVATTEILRVHSIASQASLERAAERIPDLQKQWQHIHAARVPRVSHLIADGQVRGVQEPFLVGGEELMFPRDPNGSAENTINCHCLQKPYFAPETLKASVEDKQLLDMFGISVDMAA